MSGSGISSSPSSKNKITDAISNAIDSVTGSTKYSVPLLPFAARTRDRGDARDRGGTRDRGDARDRGAAVVEFVMIAVLLMFLLFAVLQVATLLLRPKHRAIQRRAGARYAANKGVDPRDGGDHATALVRQARTRRLPATCRAPQGTADRT